MAEAHRAVEQAGLAVKELSATLRAITPVVLLLDRGEARGVVEILEAASLTHDYPMRVLSIARRLEELIDEPRPYPSLPPRQQRPPGGHLANRVG